MKKILLLVLLALLCPPALAQSNDSLVVLFLSQPGVRPAGALLDSATISVLSRFDATGDGMADLILQRDDAQGNLLDLRVLDGRTRDLVLEIRDVPTALGFNVGFPPVLWGFADANGDGQREAIFAAADVLRAYDLNPNDLSYAIQGPLQLVGALDLTGDGLEELIIYLPDTRQVQVWTKAD